MLSILRGALRRTSPAIAVRRMSHQTPQHLLPPVNRAMTTLDRSFFERDVPLVQAFFSQPKLVGEFTKKFAKDVLKLKKVRNVLRFDDGTRGVLLKEELSSVSDAQAKLSTDAWSFIQTNNVELKPYTLKLDYDFWRSEDILAAVLPEHLLTEVPSGFTITGHIAHLNLRDEFKPYGSLIGQVILDKNPNIRTVVDKVDTIHAVYRTFPMKVIAGDEDLIVEQRESGCVFQFDFEKVYWNSRLHTEHDRLVNMFQEGDLVCDVMAGVGPFSVPAGKKKVFVLSNDLNPDSYKWMTVNLEKNRVTDFVKPMNLDGRVVIQDCVKYCREFSEERKGQVSYTSRKRKGEQPVTHTLTIPKFPKHFVMNLPDSALEFLNEYGGIYADYPEMKELAGFELPFVHVYCFWKFSPDEPEPSMEELHRRVHNRMCEIMDYKLDFDTLQFQFVRQVAPTKPMFRVTFRLPEELAFRPRK
ncbi:CYFA0S03e05116g1_1 [Cyberlindnera fabianii]|uniref:tRNA (guanine(37)-N1)-methyltransferase n=1 Tax=Cyberlindnera fabianii TaxID=36022 RepID=A0A061APY2_CYBFA|nr:hypothetical protein BON22_5099 [Cyberlindnera fabianii]CDR39596.1 CYFA0S03e05116g1_1 [Cyberlindnera fabianii]